MDITNRLCVCVCFANESGIKSKLAFRTSQDLYVQIPFYLLKIIPPGSLPYISDTLASLVFFKCAESFPTPKPGCLCPECSSPSTAQAGSSAPSGLSSAQCSFTPDPNECAPCCSPPHFLHITHHKLPLFVFLHIVCLPN